jgi:AraC-like DNA-binding protein
LQDESIGSWLKLFLIACNRLKSETISTNLPFQNNSSRIIRQFKELIDSLYKKFHKVSEYAGEMNITSNYLNEVIKSETGHSAKELIQDRIMLEAKRLATYSDLQLKEISFELGFEDPAHFSKFFKNLSGTDFSSFREQIRKKYL